MCRLFGMHAGQTPVEATFWLEDAPDSLSAQSRQNPDGFGIGTFSPRGRPLVDKEPRPAWEASGFDTAAHRLRGTVFVAHVRKASTGTLLDRNTHPFLQDGRLFAHNGVVGGLDKLDDRLTRLGASDLVHGDTDSERVFALITAETARHDGDLGAGIGEAVEWVAAELPLFALNFVLITPTELWALRYPDTHDLFVLDRPSPMTGPETPAVALHQSGSLMTAHSDELAGGSSVLVASEQMDAESAWHEVPAGALLHVGPALEIRTAHSFTQAPAHPLTLTDLDPVAASSQQS